MLSQFNYLTVNEYRQLTVKQKREYQKEYRIAINEAAVRLRYAEEFTPHKVGYYRYLHTDLINNAPVGLL